MPSLLTPWLALACLLAHGVQFLSCACCACRRELLRGPLYYVLMLVAITLVYWRESPAGFLVRAWKLLAHCTLLVGRQRPVSCA